VSIEKEAGYREALAEGREKIALLSMAALAKENDRLRATIDTAIRILSDDRLPLQSRVNDARAILSR
jgi:hypothetical protein